MANKAVAVQQLMAKGANLNATTSKGWTPLHIAAYHGSLEAAAVLIDGCEDLEADVSVMSQSMVCCRKLFVKYSFWCPKIKIGK